MKKYGRNSKIISAYSALATVAAGVVAFAFTHPSERILIADFSSHTLTAGLPGIALAGTQVPVTSGGIATASPKAKAATGENGAKRVTIASYIAPHAGM